MFVEHTWIKARKFVEQHFIFSLDVVGVARHHKEKERVALNVAEETQTEALTLTGTFDDTRNIGHHKGAVVTIRHDAQ